MARNKVLSGFSGLFFVFAFLMTFSGAVFATGVYDGGDGSEGNPFQIANAQQLIELSQHSEDWVMGLNFILTADIDMDPNLLGEGVEMSPIGIYQPSYFDFSGVFDGNGHVISNLTISLPDTEYVGFFGSLSGKVKKLGLENVHIEGHSKVGGIAGNCNGSISECYVTGSVKANMPYAAGGLVGIGNLDYNSLIDNCYNRASVSGYTTVAGLIGYFTGRSEQIINCYSSGSLESQSPDNTYGLYSEMLPRHRSGCFWDTDTSGTTRGFFGTGLQTEFMKSMEFYSFAGWSGDIWTIDDGNDYPRLTWENKPGEPIADPSTALEGAGTAENPYLISSNEDLMILSRFEELWDKHFVLTSDLDVDGLYVTPIGYYAPNRKERFTGVFDGGGHVISNLRISGLHPQTGLFGYVGSGGKITQLGLENVLVIGSYYQGGSDNGVGGLAGCVEGGYVSQCYTTGVVTDSIYGLVGGLVGCSKGTTEIINCYSHCSVTGNNYSCGGFAGNNAGSGITNCYSTGSVERLDGGAPGGLVGSSNSNIFSSFWDTETSGVAEDIYGVGKATLRMMNSAMYRFAGWDGDVWTIDENNDYPHLAWENSEGKSIGENTWDGSAENPIKISNAWELIEFSIRSDLWDKHIVLTADIDMDPEVTGIAPFDNSLIAPYTGSWDESLLFTGSFDGRGHIISNLNIYSNEWYIGLFGIIWGGEVKNLGIDNSSVTGDRNVGGLAGRVMGKINCCYFSGSVTGAGGVGGLLGNTTDAEVSDCYSKGWVSGSGLVGYNFRTTISRCYSTCQISDGNGAGFCSSLGSGSAIVNCFWDTQSSGTNDGVGGVDPDPAGVTGLTTGEMYTVSTFTDAGWDFVGESVNGDADTWRLCGDGYSYPRLAWEYSRRGDFACGEGVDAVDLGVLAADWLKEGQSQADANFDGKVNIEDMAVLARYWL